MKADLFFLISMSYFGGGGFPPRSLHSTVAEDSFLIILFRSQILMCNIC